MADEDVYSFVAVSIPSVWALELLFLLKRAAPSGRSANDLVQELRSSHAAIAAALIGLQDAGLIVEDAGAYRYGPAAETLNQLVVETEKLYALKPTAMVTMIVNAPNNRLQIFANSFKLKE